MNSFRLSGALPVNTMENQHTMAARKATMLRMYSQMNCGMKINQFVRTLTGGIFAGPGGSRQSTDRRPAWWTPFIRPLARHHSRPTSPVTDSPRRCLSTGGCGPLRDARATDRGWSDKRKPKNVAFSVFAVHAGPCLGFSGTAPRHRLGFGGTASSRMIVL